MWFGVSARGKPIFALPGNPVSTLVCATRYVAAGAARSVGPRPRAARSSSSSRRRPKPRRQLTYFMPVPLASSAAGALLAAPRPTNTSGDFVALAGTDGFVELAREARRARRRHGRAPVSLVAS